MEDTFIELVLPKKPTPLETMRKPLLVLVTVLLAVAGFFIHPFFIIGLLVMIFVDSVVFPRFNVEYEYSYVNGELDIAAIYSKSSRKELAQIDLTDAECIAPLGSHELDAYGDTFKTVDYSVRQESVRPFVAVKGGETKQKILVQLNDPMLSDLRTRMPRKVHPES